MHTIAHVFADNEAIRPSVCAGFHRISSKILLGVFLATAWNGQAFARGDKCIPQIADGAGRIRTKIDIHNVSPAVVITRVKIYFYRPDGSPWVVATNLGTESEYFVDLGRSQTMRIETLGLSDGLNSGYAVIRDSEWNSASTSDYQLAVSVFYEVLDGSRVVDTVSVPIGQPCLRWVIPVEIDHGRGIFSGIALVNLATSANRVTFHLWTAFLPPSADARDGGTVSLQLKPGEQRARFLNEPGLFPEYPVYRGVLVGTAEKPVAVLGMMQTQSAGGIQYSTLSAEYTDALHSESYVYLPQGLSVDADSTRVPFLTLDDDGSRDLRFQPTSSSVRRFIPENGASFAPLRIRTASEMNNLLLQDLQALSYDTTPIEFSENSVNLVAGIALAMKTSKGHFAKLRVDRVVSYGEVKDVVLQVRVYR